MHIREWSGDFGTSNSSRLPIEVVRASQKVLLVVAEGDIDVFDIAGDVRRISGPSWVVWFPGELIRYLPVGDTTHWVFVHAMEKPPNGFPRPGSLVELETSGKVLEAVIFGYSRESGGPVSFGARIVGGGAGSYAGRQLRTVVAESDEDITAYDFGPGLDRPRLQG